MDRQEILTEYLKALRIGINNAQVYFKEHPYFLASVDKFKDKTDEVLGLLDPVSISFTQETVYFDGRYWQENRIYKELAEIFHLRKIKSVVLKKGVDKEELLRFFAVLSLPPKELIKEGGINSVFITQENPHIQVEELDYYTLLHGQGGALQTDIWINIFSQPAGSIKSERLRELSEKFEQMLKFTTAGIFVNNKDVRVNIEDFLASLRVQDIDKYIKCLKSFLSAIIRDRSDIKQEDLFKLKEFFLDLGEEAFSDAFWQDLMENRTLSKGSLQVFSFLSGGKDQSAIASELTKRSAALTPKENQQLQKKVKELLVHLNGINIPDNYRVFLDRVLPESLNKGQYQFDKYILELNYRYILAHLVREEEDQAPRLVLIVNELIREMEKTRDDCDWGYTKFLLDSLGSRAGQEWKKIPEVDRLYEVIAQLLEVYLLQGNTLPQFEYFLPFVRRVGNTGAFYLEKIFSPNSPREWLWQMMSVYFRLFPSETNQFCERLDLVKDDINLTSEIIEAIKKIKAPQALNILSYLYRVSGNMIRMEVLRALEGKEEMDAHFLLQELKTADYYLRKKILFLLSRDPEASLSAVDIIFARRNKFMESMEISASIKFLAARNKIEIISRMPFFWNRKIRNKARKILEKWNA